MRLAHSGPVRHPAGGRKGDFEADTGLEAVLYVLEMKGGGVSPVAMNFARVLQRLPDVRLHLDARNEVVIEQRGQRMVCGPQALRLLEIFAQPAAVSEALERLKPSLTGTQEWMQALRTIQQLEAAGILRERGGSVSEAPFDQASIHIAMLNDRGRTQGFLEAIRRTVKAGDVVADLGTGTGVLALGAWQTGAKKVYAIEAGAVGRKAEEVFRENGAGDRVVLVPGWSTQVALPEPVDVLIGEVLGNDPFGEDIADVFRDGVRRFLKPGGRVIPAQVELWAVVVSVPSETSAMHRFETFKEWEKAYGMSFTSLAGEDAAANFTVSPHVANVWRRLSAPVRLRCLELGTGTEKVDGPAHAIRVLREGNANGMVLYFTATLAEDIEITTDPAAVTRDGHWRNVVRMFPAGRHLKEGQEATLDCTEGYLSARLG